MASERAGRTRSVLAALAIAASTGTSVARADPTASQREVARTLMDQADALAARKDLAAALKAYEAADAIMGVPTTRIEVARAQAALGLLVLAQESALAIERIPQRPNEPPPFAEARAAAKRLAAELAERTPTVTVEVAALPAGVPAVVHLDGAIVAGGPTSAERRVDPGRHLVTVSAPGHASATREITLRERDRTVIEFELKKESPAAPRSAPAVATPPSIARNGGPPPLAWVAFGVGATSVAVGIGTGIASLAHASSARDHCLGNVCGAEARDDIDTSRTMARISDVAFGLGLVGLAAGVVVLLLDDGDEGPASARHTAADRGRIRF